MTAISLLQPLAPLVHIEDVSDDDAAVLKIINATERELTKLGISPLGYSVGELPYIYSRNERRDCPVWNNEAKLTRLLDKPIITRGLIEVTTKHFGDQLRKLLREHATHRLSRARLPHTINRKKHQQSATLLSYIMRTFCPAGTPALTPDPEQTISDEDIVNIILSLPIDPAKISDEVLKKMGLAPEDYNTYTAQARLRYKLWVRPRFLRILAHAHVFEREPTLTSHGKTTARLVSFKTEDDVKKVAVFGTDTDMYDHITGIVPRHHRAKVSRTSFRVLQNFGALLRSQEHTLMKLLEKGEYAQAFLSLSEEYGRMTVPTRYEFVCDALEYFMSRDGYYEEKIVDFLVKLLQNPNMITHINRTLRDLLVDIRGKVREIDTTYEILLDTWDGNLRKTIH